MAAFHLCRCWPVAVLVAGIAAQAQLVRPPWAAGTPYRAGDLVAYLGVDYRCLQAHLARTGLEPPAAPQLWRVFTAPEATPPAVPRGLAATADGPARILVTWGPVEGAQSYDLQVDGTLRSGMKSPFVHANLAPGSSHTYRVRAVNDAGPGAWSEAVQAATERRSPGSRTP
ncbi:carbohydrate-binding protein [Mesoterricola sediminis]|uniref:Fibronectin type-III domain-containing protein n=1 Tax=Mesoterricola sediminis TaxID=2927980 RepID=A0AA48H8T6_9BACT|nr:carbohydrate-binding protein [Mesoterricola sediminis]BDU78043.1 hypothetical protein METESE_30010 [Mesoterricola sediminis]